MGSNEVYLLLGPEEGEKANYLKNLLKQKTEELKETPEVYRYYPFETNILDVVTLLNSGSLFSSYKFVVLYDIEGIKKAGDMELLVEYCEKPSPEATLILLSGQFSISNAKLGKAIPAKNKVIFWELREGQKKDWIRNFFRRRELSIQSDAVDFLLEMVENNTRDLKQECSKLAGFFSPGSELTTENIETYVYHSKQENVFTLFEKMATRNFDLCLEVLEKLLLSGESNYIGILSGLLWQFRKLLALKNKKEQNYNAPELFKSLGITSKKSQKIYMDAHQKYSKKEIIQILLLITDFDILLRSIKGDSHDTLIQLFLYYVVIKGGFRESKENLLW